LARAIRGQQYREPGLLQSLGKVTKSGADLCKGSAASTRPCLADPQSSLASSHCRCPPSPTSSTT
jgi:hypothetical protein